MLRRGRGGLAHPKEGVRSAIGPPSWSKITIFNLRQAIVMVLLSVALFFARVYREESDRKLRMSRVADAYLLIVRLKSNF